MQFSRGHQPPVSFKDWLKVTILTGQSSEDTSFNLAYVCLAVAGQRWKRGVEVGVEFFRTRKPQNLFLINSPAMTFICYLDPQAINSVRQRTAGLEEDVF